METCSLRALGDPESAFFLHSIVRLEAAAVPFLIGGAFAFSRHTGIARRTKDLDLFVRPRDCRRVLQLFAEAGYQVRLPFPHWLGKVYSGGAFIDVIFSSGNGIATVDDLWFDHAVEGDVLGAPVRLCPAEEMIWSKSFVQERERFDGADIMHLLLALGSSLDWPRLLMRFGECWRVLLGHLIVFGFVYPSARCQVPDWVYDELVRRLVGEKGVAGQRVCNGTLLSREQYLPDLTRYDMRDGRLLPEGPMTPEEIRIWTDAIQSEE